MFSVLIPVYNHRRYVPAAILSALRSHFVSELLLVDDGSSDGSHEFVNRQAAHMDPRVRVLPTPEGENLGAHARLNQLAGEARQDWLAVLNSDDCFTAARFNILARLLRGKDWQFVAGHLAIMDDNGRRIGSKRGPLTPEFPFPGDLDPAALLMAQELLPLLACQNFVATTSNMLFTKALFEKVGGFADYRYAHDWDFALRAAVLGSAAYIPQFLTIYRSHASNTIKENKSAITEEVRRLFETVRGDLPAAFENGRVRTGLSGNRYLTGAA